MIRVQKFIESEYKYHRRELTSSPGLHLMLEEGDKILMGDDTIISC